MQHTNLFDLAAIISQLGTFSGNPNALGGAGNLFQGLSKREQAFNTKKEAEQRLQDLIGNAATPGVPFDINNSPLLPVEPVAGTGFAGQVGLQSNQVELLKNLAGNNPSVVTKAITDQLFKTGTKNDAKNFSIDALGRPFGTIDNIFQQLPELDPSNKFTKFKTVQGTDPSGIPQTELVNLAQLEINNGRVTIGKKQPLPTQAEANKIASTESSISIIDDLKSIMSGKNPPELGGLGNFVNEMKAGTGITGVLTRMFTDPLTVKQAKLLSLSEALGNQILQAVRGANVGPDEQERFERQLPRPGQPLTLFNQNIIQTEKNLRFLNQRIRELRKLGKSNSKNVNTTKLPPGFTMVTP